MSSSVVVSWSPPEDSLTAITQYHVCVDSVVRAVVPGTYKTKALIEDINLTKVVQISVRSVTENGHSSDAACTISIGAGTDLGGYEKFIATLSGFESVWSQYYRITDECRNTFLQYTVLQYISFIQLRV
ncbi:unnamed protein product [Enterobius vermicularis]|uniref:Fibronectin type-III domain-containing protein n=1 Tax=Enterobius vermicularis TaxID=51028 RepID=A0A0N4VPU3_ENTVE|nr:unnamed protein product [Enterobius vermicularis]